MTPESDSVPCDLVARCADAEAGYFELGHAVTDLGWARIVRNQETPDVWDSNCVTRVRVKDEAGLERLLAEVEVRFSDVAHRSYKVDPLTPTVLEARLLQDGYQSDVMIHLVLSSDQVLARTGASVDLRRVETEADWRSLARLARMDHVEAAGREGRTVWSEDVTTQMVARKRLRDSVLPFFLASTGGRDVAHGCAWPGTPEGGVGLVEDLFTDPAYRHQGIATAVIAHCVAFARAGGAGPVMIGAAADDTPRHMYEALGFRPTLVTRGYVKPG